MLVLKRPVLEQDTGTNANSTTVETATETEAPKETETTTEGQEPSNKPLSLSDALNGEGITQTKPSEEGNKKEDDTTPQEPAWLTQIPREMRTKELCQFNKISDLVNAYNEVSNKANEPQKAFDLENAKPEEVESYYQKMGKPKDVDGYSISKDPDSKTFREAAFKANLTEQQAKAIYDDMRNIAQQQIEDFKNAQARLYKSTEKSLQDEYGAKYGEKMELLKRGYSKFAPKSLQEKFNKAGLTCDPELVRMFIALGEATSEANTTNKRTTGAKKYVPTSQGGTFNFNL